MIKTRDRVSIVYTGDSQSEDSRNNLNNSENSSAKLIWINPLGLIIFFFSIFCKNSLLSLIIFLIVSVISIAIYTIKAYEIHIVPPKKDDNLWRRHNQYWLNGLGAFLGWAFLLYFLSYRFHLFYTTDYLISLATYKLESLDLIILLIAFLGITGYLPYFALLKGFKSS